MRLVSRDQSYTQGHRKGIIMFGRILLVGADTLTPENEAVLREKGLHGEAREGKGGIFLRGEDGGLVAPMVEWDESVVRGEYRPAGLGLIRPRPGDRWWEIPPLVMVSRLKRVATLEHPIYRVREEWRELAVEAFGEMFAHHHRGEVVDREEGATEEMLTRLSSWAQGAEAKWEEEAKERASMERRRANEKAARKAEKRAARAEKRAAQEVERAAQEVERAERAERARWVAFWAQVAAVMALAARAEEEAEEAREAKEREARIAREFAERRAARKAARKAAREKARNPVLRAQGGEVAEVTAEGWVVWRYPVGRYADEGREERGERGERGEQGEGGEVAIHEIEADLPIILDVVRLHVSGDRRAWEDASGWWVVTGDRLALHVLKDAELALWLLRAELRVREAQEFRPEYVRRVLRQEGWDARLETAMAGGAS